MVAVIKTSMDSLSTQTPFDLLRKRVLSWSKKHNTATSVRVHVDGKTFHLHEAPLISKSGFFKKTLTLSSSEIELPGSFPGGSHAFETAMLFVYGAPLPLDPFNVLALRCAAGFLEMTEDYSDGNLCEKSDLYLNQVVLQSWDDTLIVLQKCQSLLSWCEELLITSRCIESLAFMACMEILDPECDGECPLLNLEAGGGRRWSCEPVKEISGRDSWVKDLIALPFEFFQRIIKSLRKQGMKEKYVSPLIVLFANKWVLSKKTRRYSENADENNQLYLQKKVSAILLGLIELLPLPEKPSRVIPVGFFFAMISRTVSLGLNDESRRSLEEQASSLLQYARVEDFLMPASGVELKVMQRIFLQHLSSKNCGYSLMNSESIVAELWDRYLSLIVVDSKLDREKFLELIEMVPMGDRETHDHLYKAISVFLLENPRISSEDKAAVCKHLNCQKLSQSVCIEAVQNELLPIGITVKALSVQQFHTHQVLKDYSESFRYSQFGDFSGSLPSSRSQAQLNQYLGESPYQLTTEEEDNGGTNNAPRERSTRKKTKMSKAEYESASFRIQLLEKELMSLKISLKEQSLDEGADRTGLRTLRTHMKSCVGSIGWASQRKYLVGLLKAFRRIRLFGKGTKKKKRKNKQVSNRVEISSVDDYNLQKQTLNENCD